MTLVYVPREQIAPGKLVSAMLTLVRSITGVCGEFRKLERRKVEETDEISCGVRHVEDG